MSDSILSELSQELSPDEKKRLLAKIQKNLNPDLKSESTPSGSTMTKDEVSLLLKKELESQNFWQRLLMKIRQFFTGKSQEELQFNSKINHLIKTVEEVTPGLLTHKGEELSNLFGQNIYELFFSAYFVQIIWEKVFKIEGFLSRAVGDLVENRIPVPKTGVFDLISLDEMAEIYRKTGEKGAILRRIRETIPLYLGSLHSSVFKETGDDLLPLYYMRPLINFPYRLFLQIFGHDPGILPPQKFPPFNSGSIKRSTEFLDRLYSALYLACKIKELPEGFKKLVTWALESEGIKSGSSEINDKTLLDELASLHGEAQRLFSEIPFKELIKLSKQDPFFTLKIPIPTVDVKEIYQSLLLVRFSQQTEDVFQELRNSILQKEKDSLFQNQNSQLLEYYKLDINPLINTYNLPQFSHVESLNLLYTFLSSYFPVHYLPLIRTLAQVVLQSFKALMSSLLQISGSLEELKAEIYHFDINLGPTAEEGKTLILLKLELEAKPTSHQLFSTLVERKNRESQKLITQIMGLLEKLIDQFTIISNHTSPQMRSLLKMPYIMGGARSKISEAVQEKIIMLKKIVNLITEINSTENSE